MSKPQTKMRMRTFVAVRFMSLLIYVLGSVGQSSTGSCMGQLQEPCHSAKLVRWASSILENTVRTNGALAFLTCSEHRERFDDLLLRAYPGKITPWTGSSEELVYALAANRVLNIRTVVVVTGVSQEKVSCVRHFLAKYDMPYLAEWIVFHDDRRILRDREIASLNTSFSLCGGGPISIVPVDVAKCCQNVHSVSLISRMCPLIKSPESTRFTLPPAARVVKLATIPYKGVEQTCPSLRRSIIYTALRAQNATLSFKTYDHIYHAYEGILRGEADVLDKQIPATPQTSSVLILMPVLDYARETLYTWRGSYSAETTFLSMLKHSLGAFLLIVFTVIASWLALACGNRVELGRSSSADSMLFLVASLLSNFSPMDHRREGRAPSHRWSFRKVFILLWVVAIMPLSVYFRGELTSRLTITGQPDFMDTLEEVESALDKNRLVPCLYANYTLLEIVDSDSDYIYWGLYTKLWRAFENNVKSTPLLFDTKEACFRCARRQDFACFVVGLEDWQRAVHARQYVELRERLKLSFITIGTRKDYAHARVFHNIVRRLLETAVYPRYVWWKGCGADNVLVESSSDGNTPENKTQSQNLSAFFVLFNFMLMFCCLVFCLELLLGWREAVGHLKA